MYKQIFEKKNGNPILLEERFDEISMVAVFDYDKEIYTDKKPSSDLYQPIQFDNDLNDWVGSSFDEWIETNKPRTPYNPEKGTGSRSRLIIMIKSICKCEILRDI